MGIINRGTGGVGVGTGPAPKFISGAVYGSDTADQFVYILLNHLLAHGWECADAQNNVYKGVALSANANNYPSLSIRNLGSTMELIARCSPSGLSGNYISGVDQLNLPVGQFSYFIRANGVSFVAGTKNRSGRWCTYGGFLRRLLPYSASGLTQLAQTALAGTTVLNVTSDLRGQLFAGQPIQLVRMFGNSTGTLPVPNVVKKVTASEIHLASPLAETFLTPTCVGSDPQPNVVGRGAQAPITAFVHTAQVNGRYVSGTPAAYTSSDSQTMGGSSFLAAVPMVLPPLMPTVVSADLTTFGVRGVPYHYIRTVAPANTIADGDVAVDGDDRYLVVGGANTTEFMLVKMND